MNVIVVLCFIAIAFAQKQFNEQIEVSVTNKTNIAVGMTSVKVSNLALPLVTLTLTAPKGDYEVLVKKDVAAPAAQGTKNWNEKGFGFKAVFKGNVTQVPLALVNGNYFVTVHKSSGGNFEAGKVTVSLAGTRCDNADEVGATCAKAQPVNSLPTPAPTPNPTPKPTPKPTPGNHTAAPTPAGNHTAAPTPAGNHTAAPTPAGNHTVAPTPAPGNHTVAPTPAPGNHTAAPTPAGNTTAKPTPSPTQNNFFASNFGAVKTYTKLGDLYFTDSAQISAQTGKLNVEAALNFPAQNGTTLMVYVRAGGAASKEMHDAVLEVKEGGFNKTVSKSIALPVAGEWYFHTEVTGLKVNTTFAGQYHLTATLANCNGDKYGADCKLSVKSLQAPGQLLKTAEAKEGQWFFYEYTRNASSPTNATALGFAAAQVGSKAPLVVARLGALPTETAYDLKQCTLKDCAGAQSTLLVPESQAAQGTWFIGVKAVEDGELAVWNAADGACAAGCSKHGKCEEAQCTCESDFESFDCASPKPALERWEWALIIGGGVLVAIGLIGCVVYFIQRQQRRAGFERV